MDIVFLAVIFIVIAIVYYIIGPTLKHNFDKRLHKLQLKDIESTVSENMDEFQIPSEGWKR